MLEEGVEVLSLGLCGTEEVYWATTYFKASGGIVVTASHNPINYNGLKLVKHESKPLDQKNEFEKIKHLAELNSFQPKRKKGFVKDVSAIARTEYVNKVLSFVKPKEFKKLKIVVNFGNGAAGPTFDSIENEISKICNQLDIIKVFHKPDHSFPNGIPNPMLKKNQKVTSRAVLKTMRI